MIIFGVALTVALMLGVGIAVAKKVDGDSANYLVAGRSFGVPLVAVALATSAVDSNAIVGNTDLSSGAGFWAGASLAIGLAICLLISGLFLAKPMNRIGLYTLADFFRRRYDRKTEVTASVLMIFAFTILLAGNLVAMGFLIEYFTGLPYAAGVVVAVLLVLAYTIGGGLYSDTYAAVIQAVITVVATVSLFVWVAIELGISVPDGMGPFDLEQLTSADAGATINWATLIALGVGDLVAIDFMQRIFSARTPEIAQKSCFIGAGFTFGIGVLWSLIALTATDVLGLTADVAPVMFQLLDGPAPVLLAMLALSGIVAASFSTASGAILATSAIAVRNILGIRKDPETSGDPLLRSTRRAMIPVVVIGIFLAIRVSQTGIMLALAFDLMLTCLIAPFIGGLFWRRSTVTAALVSAVVGGGVRIVFLIFTPTIFGAPNDLFYIENTVFGAGFDGWATMVAFAVAVTAFVVTARLTEHSVEEEVDLRHADRFDEVQKAAVDADLV
ncbi:MAG: sodium:solute symporter family protein [Rhodococcus sp. (in: high G+C Gram-positive bacteria)]